MSDWSRERTIGTLILHAAFHNDGGLIDCMCGAENLTVTEHAEHVTDELDSAPVGVSSGIEKQHG